MNIKVNSVNFTGKKEVLYALTKAAQKAKDFEYYNQPSVASRMTLNKNIMQASQDASMQAYLDMVLRDYEFKSVVKNATPVELAYIQGLLKPERTEHGLVEPMKKFSKAFEDAVTNNYGGIAKESAMSYVSELLQKLKL